jgi:hypothetical protein
LRLYDIALTLIRASVALGIIGEVGQHVWDLQTLSAQQATSAIITKVGPASLNPSALFHRRTARHPRQQQAPARFAATFAVPTDAAADFR